MTLHDDADTKYAAFKKRWAVIDTTAKEWMDKLQAMVGVWQKQAETVEKVQNHFSKLSSSPNINFESTSYIARSFKNTSMLPITSGQHYMHTLW